MKHIITFGLIIALCWMTWVPALAQTSETFNDYYFFNQIFVGTYMSILTSLSGGLITAGLGYFISSPIFGECQRSCLKQQENTARGSGILGFLAGTALGALYGVSSAAPEGVKGNWITAIIGAGIGELAGIGATFYLILLRLHNEIDTITLVVQSSVITAAFTSIGATIGFNLGATTSD